jgi:hypothetical protein
VSKEVRSFARPTGAHRMTVRVGFHYRHPPNEVRRALLGALRGAPGVVDHPAPDCGPTEFGDSAVVSALRYWITDFARDTTINEEVLTRIWYAARRADLEMPFPTHALLTEHGVAGARAAAAERDCEAAARLLDATAPFARMDPERRRRCAQRMRRLEFGRGERLLPEEDGEAGLYVIDSGEAAVRGTARVLTLRAGELLGRAVLPTHDACTAETDVVLWALDRLALDEAVADDPALGPGLAAIAASRLDAVGAHGDPAGPSGAAPGRRARALPRLRRLFRQA